MISTVTIKTTLMLYEINYYNAIIALTIVIMSIAIMIIMSLLVINIMMLIITTPITIVMIVCI